MLLDKLTPSLKSVEVKSSGQLPTMNHVVSNTPVSIIKELQEATGEVLQNGHVEALPPK